MRGNKGVRHPRNAEDADHSRHACPHDGTRDSVVELRTANDQNKTGGDEHTDLKKGSHADGLAAVGRSAKFGENAGENHAGHAKNEDHRRKAGTRRKRLSFRLGFNGLDESRLELFLINRIVLEVLTIPEHDGRRDDHCNERCRQRDHQNSLQTIVIAILREKSDERRRASRDRARDKCLLGSYAGGRHGALGTNADTVRDFVDHGHQALRNVGRPCEKGKEPGDKRRHKDDAIRIGADDLFGDANHVVHAAGGIHDGCCRRYGNHDEKYVYRSRGRPQAEDGDKQKEADTAPDAESYAGIARSDGDNAKNDDHLQDSADHK